VSDPPSVEEADSPVPFLRDGECGLYIHTPFCETKCGYCDFYSVAMKDRDPGPLVDAVIAELRSRVQSSSLLVRTIFLGGGTPTVLPHAQLDRLLDAVVDVVPMDGVSEFTVEANPATVDDAKAESLVSHGVTRVSMGAQSFLPNELATLERLHTPDDIAPSVETLRRCGISNINLDLIFGIPGQSVDTWQQSVHRALDLGVQHLACYGLTYEPATRLTAQKHAGSITPCDENLEADMFEKTRDWLAAAGLQQYEISNFARPGYPCRHNLVYWRNETYIGVGPSAAGCAYGRRHKNVADVNRYVSMIAEQGQAEIDVEEVTPETLVLEIILMQLRLVEGISIDRFRQQTGHHPRDLFGETLSRLQNQGLVLSDDRRIALTQAGLLMANAVMAELAAAIGHVPRVLPVLPS